jgi:WD40 repeat protein
VESGRQVRALTGHTDEIESVAFSPDGRLLASGSWDLTVKLWEVTGGNELITLTGHSGWVKSVAFSPDGATLASGTETVRLWGVAP